MEPIIIPSKDFAVSDPNKHIAPRFVVLQVDASDEKEAFEIARSNFDDLPKFALRRPSDVFRYEETRSFFAMETQRRMSIHCQTKEEGSGAVQDSDAPIASIPLTRKRKGAVEKKKEVTSSEKLPARVSIKRGAPSMEREKGEEKEKEDPPPVKRSRGRPFGSVKKAKAVDDTPKRGPGTRSKSTGKVVVTKAKVDTPKRGPGRTCKSIDKVETAKAKDDTPKRGPGTRSKSIDKVETAKRGTGRRSLSMGKVVAGKAVEDVPKRGDRSKSNCKVMAAKAKEAKDDTPKRGRGRPRKAIVPGTEEEEKEKDTVEGTVPALNEVLTLAQLLNRSEDTVPSQEDAPMMAASMVTMDSQNLTQSTSDASTTVSKEKADTVEKKKADTVVKKKVDPVPKEEDTVEKKKVDPVPKEEDTVEKKKVDPVPKEEVTVEANSTATPRPPPLPITAEKPDEVVPQASVATLQPPSKTQRRLEVTSPTARKMKAADASKTNGVKEVKKEEPDDGEKGVDEKAKAAVTVSPLKEVKKEPIDDEKPK